MMLSQMESHDSSVRVGRGARLRRDGIWLQDSLLPPPIAEGAPAVREAKNGQRMVQTQEEAR